VITMKEIGRLAGVSQPAVSMVLNGRAKEFNLSAETAERVWRIARENGFHPNLLARSMRTGRTGIVGILVSAEWMQQIAGDYGNGGIAMRLQAGFLLAGCRVMLETVSVEDCRTLKMPELLSSGLAEFMVVAQNFADEAAGQRYLENLYRQFGKLVLVDDIVADGKIPSVTIDNVQAGRDAADFLWRLGHRSFGTLCSECCRLAHQERLTAFGTRLAELSGGKTKVVSAFAGDRWQLDCGGIAVGRLLEITDGSLPSAIFATNDFFAYGAELELLRRGIRIPEEVSLLGVGEWPTAAAAPVPITVVAMDTDEKIKIILRLWRQYQAGQTPEQNDFRLRGRLCKRQSTGKARKKT